MDGEGLEPCRGSGFEHVETARSTDVPDQSRRLVFQELGTRLLYRRIRHAEEHGSGLGPDGYSRRLCGSGERAADSAATDYRQIVWRCHQFASLFRSSSRIGDAGRFGASIGVVQDYDRPTMPIYEFTCDACGQDFEELVGPHVGVEVGQVTCPECGSRSVDRTTTSSYSPIHRTMTPNQRRRSEQSRSADLAARKADFSRRRKAAREARNRPEKG